MSNGDTAGVVRFIRGAASACGDELSDAELVQRFVSAGDEQAFRALVGRHGPVVWSVCRRLARNHHDAEDAFQATLLLLARKAGGLRSGAAVGGWLYGVAYRVASRSRAVPLREATTPDPLAASCGDVLDDLSIREAEAIFHEELARLPEQYRAALVLCCLEGLARDEAARRLGWSLHRVKNCLEQGRERLRSRLARRGLAFGVPFLMGLLAPSAEAAPPQLVEAAVRSAVGASSPSAGVVSLANGVNRVMWISKWKWAAIGCAVLMLAGGATVAALRSPEPDRAPQQAIAIVADAPKPAAKPPLPEAPPKPPWEIATEFLQLTLDGKIVDAQMLTDPRAVSDRDLRDLHSSGLKRVKVAMILINDQRVTVVTEKAKLAAKIGEAPADGHVVVTVERKDPTAAWVVRDLNVRDTERVMGSTGRYLDGGFNFKPPTEPVANPKEPKPAWGIAAEFLQLTLDNKTAAALKLCMPNTVVERQLDEVRASGLKRVRFAMILINDTRLAAVTEESELVLKPGEKPTDGHAVVTLERKDATAPALVRDIDGADGMRLEDRIGRYLAGNFNLPPTPEEVSTEFLQLALDGRVADAKALCTTSVSENKIAFVQKSGLKSAKVIAVYPDARKPELYAVTEKATIATNSSGATEEGHLVLTLKRAKDGEPWRVNDIDFEDAATMKQKLEALRK